MTGEFFHNNSRIFAHEKNSIKLLLKDILIQFKTILDHLKRLKTF